MESPGNPEPPLTDEEISKLRLIIEHDERIGWLWAGVRRWAAWISAVIVGAYATYDVVWKFFFKPKGGG